MQPISSSDSGETPQLVGRHRHLTAVFELLADSLGPFIDVLMQAHFAEEHSWLDAASSRLGRPVEHGHTDPFFQLLVLRRFWGPVFGDSYGEDIRPLIETLMDARNRWAHFNLPDDPAILDTYILAAERVIVPASPEGAAAMRRLRTSLREQASSGSESNNAKPEQAEIDRLTAQLDDSERLFDELQDKYSSVQSTLAVTQKNADSRQNKLRTMEEELLTIYGRSDALEFRLATERSSRDRVEWLFVGLIAVLLVVLALMP